MKKGKEIFWIVSIFIACLVACKGYQILTDSGIPHNETVRISSASALYVLSAAFLIVHNKPVWPWRLAPIIIGFPFYPALLLLYAGYTPVIALENLYICLDMSVVLSFFLAIKILMTKRAPKSG